MHASCSSSSAVDSRHDWQAQEVRSLYDLPFMELVYRAAEKHRQFHDPLEMQVCRLISIKTGGCPEDCSYCSQSSRYQTGIDSEPMMQHERVLAIARKAKESGITRVCMGAAWREVKDSKQFQRVLAMVRDVTAMDLEVCCTLGMLTEDQARQLEAAGLYAYNHNLDTSPEFYETIITTRTYADRLKTIGNVRKTGVTVCSGGIIGMGESLEDRLALLQTLASLNPHPDSVPINVLQQVAGTPMADLPDVPAFETIRMIAIARLLMPRATVRLSTGRSRMSAAEQALCFMAGANSIFSSDEEKMLTDAAPAPDYDADRALLDQLGLKFRPPFKDGHARDFPSQVPGEVPAGQTVASRTPTALPVL